MCYWMGTHYIYRKVMEQSRTPGTWSATITHTYGGVDGVVLMERWNERRDLAEELSIALTRYYTRLGLARLDSIRGLWCT